MPLPNLEQTVPQFRVTLPSTGEVLTFRPFLVKEEKLLLLAQEAEDDEAVLDAVIQIISACTLSPLKVENLASFDLEYLFLQLRARSVSELVELTYRCRNNILLTPEMVGKKASGPKADAIIKRLEAGEEMVLPCDQVVNLKVNLDDIAVAFPENHTKTVFLTDTIGFNMRYPNFRMEKLIVPDTDSIETALQRIALCVESVFDENSVYTNFQLKEIKEWLGNLTQPQFERVRKFFDTMPKLAHDVEFNCPACGYSEMLHLEGLATFFG